MRANKKLLILSAVAKQAKHILFFVCCFNPDAKSLLRRWQYTAPENSVWCVVPTPECQIHRRSVWQWWYIICIYLCRFAGSASRCLWGAVLATSYYLFTNYLAAEAMGFSNGSFTRPDQTFAWARELPNMTVTQLSPLFQPNGRQWWTSPAALSRSLTHSLSLPLLRGSYIYIFFFIIIILFYTCIYFWMVRVILGVCVTVIRSHAPPHLSGCYIMWQREDWGRSLEAVQGKARHSGESEEMWVYTENSEWSRAMRWERLGICYSISSIMTQSHFFVFTIYFR